MKLNQIMRTDVGPERLPHGLAGDSSLTELAVDKIEAAHLYEVTGPEGEKTGEVSGRLLLYLRKAMERLDLGHIINAFEDGVVVLDAGGRIIFENDAYSRIVGVPMRKTIGKDMHHIEPDALLLKVLETGVPLQRERQLIQSVGKYVAMRIFPIFRGGKVEGAFSVFRDVTELNELNREVRRITGVAEEFGSRLNATQAIQNMHIVGRGAAFERLIARAGAVAPTDATVLVRGENGSGKEIITKYIHQNSSRKEKPMITVNCAAIPESLIESELFGYEEGAFTGAKRGGKVGKFELAQGGTIFLDEIGDMPMVMQAKLLRVLQEGEIEKIGREANIPVDVRVIAATNQPLEELIAQKKFRQDLYFRLNVVSLTIPPLRERTEDILPLANQFLEDFNQKYKKQVTLGALAYYQLTAYSWPGNVRELQSCIESAVIMAQTKEIVALELPTGSHDPEEDMGHREELPPRSYGTMKEEQERFERELIYAVLRECAGDREAAIQKLDISLRTFYRKLRQ